MRVSTRAALVLLLATASAAVAGPSFHVHRSPAYVAPHAYPVPYAYAVPYAYPVPYACGWHPPVPYGTPYPPVPPCCAWDPDYFYRQQPGFRFHEPEGRRGFGIHGYTLPGGR
jgi:hypothetical protein